MKKNIMVFLTAAMTIGCTSAVFASDALSQKYAELEKAELNGVTGGYTAITDEYSHAEPNKIEFNAGVLSGKIADFDADGADELLTVYAKDETFYVQMYEEKDGKAVLAAESDKIDNFLSGEKGGGCVFFKKLGSSDRIFMQYTGEVNSYADGADFRIKGFDYNGSKFETVLEIAGGGSAADFSEEEAMQFKDSGLDGTFAMFVPDKDENGEMRYHFDPYYEGLNIGKLESEKEMLTDITVTTNIFDIYDKIDWEKQDERNAAAEKDGKITVKVDDKTAIKAEAKEEAKEEVKEEVKTEEKDPNEIAVYLNGEKMSFDADPYIENGTTRVPMRAIFEGLGADVNWDNDKKLVTAEKDGVEIKLTIGEETALVNGAENKLLVPAEIKNSRTMVPLRFVSEALGAKVDWDGETKTITITSEAAPTEEKTEESGTYEKTYSDEIEGEKVEYTYSVKLNDDKTGLLSMQDEIPVTWSDGEIKTEDGTTYSFKIENGKLTLDMDGVKEVFEKKN